MLCLICGLKERIFQQINCYYINRGWFVSKYRHDTETRYDLDTYLTITDKHIDLRFYFSVPLLKELCNTKLLKLYRARCPQTNLF